MIIPKQIARELSSCFLFRHFYLGATWVAVVKAGQGHNALGLGQVVINGFYLSV